MQPQLSVKGGENGERIPLTFRSIEEYRLFQAELRAALRHGGVTGAVVQQVGSATTGWRGNPDKPFVPWSPTSDADLAVFSEQALGQAMKLGTPLNTRVIQDGRYTSFRNRVEVGENGFCQTPVGRDLSRLAERWNQRIYGDPYWKNGFDFKLNTTVEPFKRGVTVGKE